MRAPPGRNQPVAAVDLGGFKGGVANMQATMAAAAARKAKAEWGGSGADGEDAWAPPEASATLWDAIAVKANSYGKPQAAGERRSCQASTGVRGRRWLCCIACCLRCTGMLLTSPLPGLPLKLLGQRLACLTASWC